MFCLTDDDLNRRSSGAATTLPALAPKGRGEAPPNRVVRSVLSVRTMADPGADRATCDQVLAQTRLKRMNSFRETPFGMWRSWDRFGWGYGGVPKRLRFGKNARDATWMRSCRRFRSRMAPSGSCFARISPSYIRRSLARRFIARPPRMCRVAVEARAFPLLTPGAQRSPFMDGRISDLKHARHHVTVTRFPTNFSVAAMKCCASAELRHSALG